MNSSTLCNSWHKLSNGDSSGLALSSTDDDDDNEVEEESDDKDEVEADGERDAALRSCCCACVVRSCICMYAMCASETSSCRLLRGGAARKERRKTRAIKENMVGISEESDCESAWPFCRRLLAKPRAAEYNTIHVVCLYSSTRLLLCICRNMAFVHPDRSL